MRRKYGEPSVDRQHHVANKRKNDGLQLIRIVYYASIKRYGNYVELGLEHLTGAEAFALKAR